MLYVVRTLDVHTATLLLSTTHSANKNCCECRNKNRKLFRI